jgi:tetratricopeptide (TPR) repeat protein
MLTILAIVPPEFGMLAAGVVAFGLARGGLGWMRLESGEYAGLGALAAATLLLHLSATGGISYPGVLPWLFLVVVLAVSAGSPRIELGRIAAVGVSLAFAVLACATQFWAAPPTLATGPALSTAEEAARSLSGGAFPQAEREALQALALDPYLAETKDAFPPPTETLVDVRWALFMREPTDARLNAILAAGEEAVRRNPANYRNYRFLGDRLFMGGVAAGRADLLERAIERYGQAIERYPNSSSLRAQFAMALAAAGRRAEAETALAEAERLDALNPHEDQRLARQLVVDPSSPTGNATVGDWLARFRASGKAGAESPTPKAN